MEMFPSGKLQGPYFGKVTAYEVITVNVYRWRYTVDLVQLGADDWLDFDIVPEASGVLNVFESGNTTTSSMGIAHSNLPGSIELKPCPIDTVVPLWMHPNGYVMMWPNQFDGDCS